MMIPRIPFGRTGHDSSRVIFGSAALGSVTQAVADATLDVLLKFGVNHIDTAAGYGEAELRLGPWMRQHRESFFLATKTTERLRVGAWDSLLRSLERLQVDSVDLIQFHKVMNADELAIVCGPGGALEACVAARAEGLVRHIGITAHGMGAAALHLRALELFEFDSVLLPYNYRLLQHAQYAADFETLMRLCQARGTAVQTIKAVARAPWGDRPHTHTTWYEPLVEQPDIDLAVHWVLGRPGIFLDTAADIHVLPKILDAANRFQSRPPEAQMQAAASRLALEGIFDHTTGLPIF